MKVRLRFLLFYFLFWLAFFQLARLAFVLYHSQLAAGIPFSEMLSSFWYGLRMDVSLGAYLFILPCLMAILSVWFHFFRRPLPYLLYTSLVMGVLLLIVLSDLELYGHWGFRIDDTPIKYLSSPREAWASVSHLPIFWILLGYIILWFLFSWITRNFLRRQVRFNNEKRGKLLTTLVLAAILPLLVIPIRGGLQLSPMNQSSVYFSRHNFANIAAINAGWNFMHGMVSASGEENLYQYMPDGTARQVVDSLYQTTSLPGNFTAVAKPNYIFIIWESFTEKAIHLSVGGEPVTPGFNRLRKEGLYFSNTYASGDRTDKGLSAILSGYPALNKSSVIRKPKKLAGLPYLTRLFKEKGYATSFYYGGETEFANIKSYLYQQSFDNIVDKHAFSKDQQNSKWGAHDGVVMNLISKDLASLQPPFFLSWLTLTSHEPYEVPEKSIGGNDPSEKFLNSIHYTDKVVTQLVEYCKKQSWWSETILVIIGDHGHILPQSKDRSQDFRIPMLWLGGALNRQGVIDRPVSQLDLFNTIAGTLDAKTKAPFSRPLFDSSSASFAFFTFNNGFGFTDSSGVVVFDNVGRAVIHQEGRSTDRALRAGKALQQIIHDDYLRR